MSSVNEELSAPPKHRLSPFEVRNTDLVSRLLAATPPYLYNMPLVPHSYFFSEMLRSLVQNKMDAAARMNNTAPHRRSRKRTWAQGRAEHFQKQETKNDSQEMPPPTWTPPKIPTERRPPFDNKPLELTLNKLPLNNNKLPEPHEPSTSRAQLTEPSYKNLLHSPPSTITSESQKDIPPHMMFPPMSNLTPPDTHSPNSSSSSTDLILPPPPPIWYPQMYPPPYGIDPLHFFIDLRVSGHIYDRKNQKDGNFTIPPPNLNTDPPNNISEVPNYGLLQRESRHTSAFSVPTPSISDPLNLTSKYQKNPRIEKNERRGKFDIKSMGFDNSTENKRSSNYILKNLMKIYHDVTETKYKHEGIDLTSPRQSEQSENEVNVKEEETKQEDDKESDKEKKCKDLRALIGLELVVDYVNHNHKPKPSISEESSTDLDSSRCSSTSAVEIVSVPDM